VVAEVLPEGADAFGARVAWSLDPHATRQVSSAAAQAAAKGRRRTVAVNLAPLAGRCWVSLLGPT
jgi:hypothetical protein